MPNFKDYTGKKFGRLEALELAKPPRRNNQTYWVCRCDCGKIVDIPIRHCVDGSTKSCGCLREELYRNQNPIVGKRQKALSNCQIRQIKNLKKQNFSHRKIAKIYSISPGTVAKYLNT